VVASSIYDRARTDGVDAALHGLVRKSVAHVDRGRAKDSRLPSGKHKPAWPAKASAAQTTLLHTP
jgi:hypothetical protein